MDPFFTIITVNYNNADGLSKTMDSVLKQTYDAFEYIVVDGDSDDGSREIMLSFGDFTFHGISEPDTGIYNAMNKGIQRSHGKYLLFLNSGDCLISENILKDIVPKINPEIPFVGCDLILDSESGQIQKSHPEKISLSHLLRKTVYHPSTFIRRDMFEKYGHYNEDNKVISDWEFFLKTLGLNTEKFQRIPVPITVFDMSGISSKKENMNTIIAEKEKVLERYLGSMKHDELDGYVLEQLRNPSKRIKYLMRIERSKVVRKITTGILGLMNLFVGKKKEN